MAIVQAINGVAETYPVKPVTPQAALVDAIDSQAGKDSRHPPGTERSWRHTRPTKNRPSRRGLQSRLSWPEI